MMKKRIMWLVMAAVLLFAALPAYASETSGDTAAAESTSGNSDALKEQIQDLQSRYDQLEKEQKEWEKKIAATKGEINALKDSQNAISGQIDNTLEQIEVLMQRIEKTNQQIDLLTESILRKQKEITLKEQEIDANNELFRQRLRAMYISDSSRSTLSVLFGADSFYELLTRIEVINRVSKANTELMDRLLDDKAALQAVQDELSEDRNEAEVYRAENEKAAADLEEKKQQLDGQYNQLSEDIELSKKQEAAYKANAAEIQKDLDAAEAEIAAIYESLQSNLETYIGGEFAWPVPGFTHISSEYGWRWNNTNFHTGTDIAGGGRNIYGANIVAANTGEVVFAQTTYTQGKGYGKYLIVDHGGGVTTLYAHCSELLVGVGDTVVRGTPIAKVGSTGWSTGPHLHFEIRLNGKTVDPMTYFR